MRPTLAAAAGVSVAADVRHDPAQEVQTIVPNAVPRGRDGYRRVDYDMLGLKFLTWDQWVRRGSSPSATMR